MSPPTADQLNFVNHSCAQLISRGLTTNFAGFGRDDVLLIRAITSLTREQAIGVDQHYRSMNAQNQSLPVKFESLGGAYGHFLSALTQSKESFHASLLKIALDSLVADTTLLNEIMTLLSHEEVVLTADAFHRKFNQNLRDRIQAKVKPNHFRLMTELLLKGRSEDQTVNAALAVEQAQTLNNILSRRGMLGLTDEATVELIDFMLTLSYSQAQEVKKQFEIQQPSQPSVETLITQRVGGALQQALLLLLTIPTAEYARKIKEACTGGADDAIWRIIGGHNVDYVNQIAEEYGRNYNADMRTIIRSNTSGRFQDALVSYLQFCPFPMDRSEETLLTYILTLNVFTLTHESVDPDILLEEICNRSKGHLTKMDAIYRQVKNGETLAQSLSSMKGRDRGESKRFLKFVVLSDIEAIRRSLRRALNFEPKEEGGPLSGVDLRAIIEALSALPPKLLEDARECYERLHDPNFFQTLQTSLASDPLLATIATALVSHGRDEVMQNTDYEGGSPEAVASEIENHLNDLTPEHLEELVMTFLTHSLTQMKTISQVYEQTIHKNLEREIKMKVPNLVAVALNGLMFDRQEFIARQVHENISDPDTINRLIGGSDKALLREMQQTYQNHFRTDLLVDLARAYPGQTEYVADVTAWITQPGLPFPI